MSKLNDLLAEVNMLRTSIDMKPLKSWKESIAKLTAIRDDLRVNIESRLKARDAKAAEIKQAVSARRTAAKAPAKPRAIKATAEALKAADKRASGAMSIVEFANVHGLNAKVVRARARKHADELAEFHVEKHVYRMTATVERLLKGGK